MRIIFCGTPQFAVPTLERLLAAGFTIDLVVTNPDEPSGRSYERKAPPVKIAAEKAGLPVFQPAKLREPATREDRKSTRLNSSHRTISYAVFCLKKKKKTTQK